MTNQDLKLLVSENRLDEVFPELLQVADKYVINDVYQLQGRYNKLSRDIRLGLVDFQGQTLIKAQITACLFDLIDSLFKTTAAAASTPASTPAPTPMNTNPLKAFNSLYRDSIHADLNSLNFVESEIRSYIAQLGSIFSNPALFNAFLQPLNEPAYNDVNTSLADKRYILQGILESLVTKEQSLRTRLEVQIKKTNDEVDFVERLNQFFTNPTPTGWKNVYTTVGERFSDRSLFGENVTVAWEVWNAKISQLDVFDIAFDLAKGERLRSDLGIFLATNLQIKNFNY